MQAPQKSLILPCETRNRELDARLLLGCSAAEQGFRVFIGAKREINMQAMRLPRSIYLQKSLSKRSFRMYDILDRVGHWIVSGDEEGIVYYSVENYWKEKIHPPTIRKARALLAWGPENERIWRSHPEFPGTPIAVTGNPRVDLLRPELSTFFKEQLDDIRGRLGSFVMINTNFAHLNHFFPNLSYATRALDAAPEIAAPGEGFEIGSARHAEILYRGFLEMVPAIARAFPDKTFVVRPHPSENHKSWQHAALHCPNVHVIHEGNVVPWLMACDTLIHNGCTTAIEAYILGKPVIAYQPAVSDEYDLGLPNRVSFSARDLSELNKLVDAACTGRIASNAKEEARKEAILDQYISGRTGQLVADRISEKLAECHENWRCDPPPRFTSRMIGRAHGQLRALEKAVNWVRPGHNNNRNYVRHVFSELPKTDVSRRIELFRESLDRFYDIRVQEISANVFQLSK